MVRKVLQEMRPLISRPRVDVTAIAVVSAIAGLAEAGVLVLVVSAAVAISDGSARAPIDLPLVAADASVTTVLWMAAGLAVAVAAMNGTIAWLSARLGANVLHAARQRLLRAYLRASWPRQSSERDGAIQESATTLATNTSNLAMSLSVGLAASIALTGMLLAAVVVDAVVTIVILAVGLLLSFVFRPIVALTRRRSSRFVNDNSEFAEEVARLASNSMESRVFGVDAPVERTIARRSRDVGRRLQESQFAVKAGLTFYRDAAVLALVGAVAVLNEMEGDRLVEIGAVSLLVIRSLGYATNVQYTLQTMSELSPSLRSLSDRVSELEASAPRRGVETIDDFETIELRGVSYRYDDRTPALDGIDLTIRRGDVIGVVGPSGSGKSTLTQLLLRLRDPDSGEILVDGLDHRELTDACWTRLVSLVPQEPQLTAASIADNIEFLRDGLDRGQIEQAAADAHVADEIQQFPAGFDTRLGPRGSGLSGGQKQRVAFARALVGAPRLLVLDEPTSALDDVSEQRLHATISALRGTVTMVIVAHRTSTLDVCDRFIRLEGGRRVDGGDERRAHR